MTIHQRHQASPRVRDTPCTAHHKTRRTQQHTPPPCNLRHTPPRVSASSLPPLPHARARLTTKQVNCNVLLRAPDKQVLTRRTGTNTTLYTAETKEIWRRQTLPDQQASRPRLTTDAYCTRAPNPLPFLPPTQVPPAKGRLHTHTHGLRAPPLNCCALHGSSVARPAVTAATPAACGRTDCCRNAVVAATCGPVRSKKKKSNTERPDHTCCGPQLRQGQRHGLTRHPLQSHTHIHDFRPRCGPSFLPARGLLSPSSSSSSSAVH